MSIKQNLLGKRFERLLVIAPAESINGAARWLCKCDCGKTKIVNRGHLITRAIQSCGCLHAEKTSQQFTTHGATSLSGFASWRAMLRRCYSHKSIGYHNYGGRGIRVCEFLRASPHNLFSLIGVRPSKSHTLDRIKVNGHYSCGLCSECLRLELPQNIQWATRKQQALNRRDNHPLTIDGETKCVSEWVEQTGIPYTTLIYRANLGYHPLKPSPGAAK